MRPDLKELIEIAERATQGEWKAFRAKNGGLIGIGLSTGEGLTDPRGGLWGDADEANANAAHIVAFQPRVVKPLLKELEEARARNKKAEELLFKSGAFLRNEAEVRAYGGRPDLPYEAAPRELADAISAFLREGKEG